MPREIEADCCVVGGGPAGMMAGLLFARAGCRTVVLEKHADFLRDFRGDTVHPSTLEVLHELGLLEAFLERPHQRLGKLSGVFGGKALTIADFSTIDARAKFIAFMPQWHFLDFLGSAAASLPTFSLEMQAEASGLIEEGGIVRGVRATTPDGPLAVRARLTIGADGRSSIIRSNAGLAVVDIGAPIDVLWFKIPRGDGQPGDEPLLNTGPGHIVITIDRGEYYQCAFVIAKGEAEAVKSRGIEAFRKMVAETVPRLATHIGGLASVEELKLLTVKIDRLPVWSRPGLLMIGDAAHAMSPIGGVGINLAIQDAVAAGNLLSRPLASGTLDDRDLEGVAARRLWAVKATQAAQVAIQKRIISPLLEGRAAAVGAPLPLRIVSRIPFLQRVIAGLVGLGVRPEHVTASGRYAITPPPAKETA